MDGVTLEALKGSIEKWRKIVEENGRDGGHSDCPLCILYWYISCTKEDECLGCPVRERAGFANCSNTPYVEWAEALEDEGEDYEAPRVKTAARAMLEFLRSLLPKEEGE